jgi:hypothetical protein
MAGKDPGGDVQAGSYQELRAWSPLPGQRQGQCPLILLKIFVAAGAPVFGKTAPQREESLIRFPG